MKTYEPFKSQAQRLTSITCDACGVELYRGRPHRAWSSTRIDVYRGGDDHEHALYDLCPLCADKVLVAVRSIVAAAGVPEDEQQ